mgnify:FL=1|tara:strand:+ start:226 stop:741 length:516 start_codon:yes stop_codon:yes gene_type:complete
MSKPLDYIYSQERLNLGSSTLAEKEKNDCAVKAIAAAAGVSYETSHAFTGEYLMRTRRMGTLLGMFLPNITKEPMMLGSKRVEFKSLGNIKITNGYKLYGEVVRRKKTVKSFIKDNPRGSFVVSVAGHALAIVDGVLIDNVGEEFRMTRKVLSAIQVKAEDLSKPSQLTLF